MKFPIANISIEEWDPLEDYLVYILMDPFIFNTDEEYFKHFYHNHKFVDSDGNIYKIVDKKPASSWLRRIFKFIPNVYYVTPLFYKTGERMETEEIRKFIISQVSKIKRHTYTTEWITQIKKAKTINEILGGI